MIQTANDIFVLHTAQTTYAFRKLPTGQLEHLYYGRKIHVCEPLDENAVAPLIEKHTFQPGNSCVYDREHDAYTLEDLCLEMSAYGKGDIREPFVELIYEDGSFSSDFVYESSVRFEGREARDAEDALPASYDEKNQVEHLCVTLKDNNSALKLELHYYIYEDCDVITRSAKLINDGENAVQIRRLMSCQVDFPTSDHVFTSFHGAWAREMRRWDVPVAAGKYVNASYTGTSSSRANPFVMLSGRETTEDTGDCYGFNLVYSGNHYEAVEVNSYGKTRFVSGINPQNFCWQLPAGESFEAPEAVMAYSKAGYNGMSQCMHRFVREHIVRGAWKKKVRPVLLNSWEAAYFDINEKKLLQLAKAGKEAGIELFVMDDGWFGDKYPRKNDSSSLGDWVVDKNKLPNGIEGLLSDAKKHGVKFGIWIEPEMANTTSELYEKHPDWVLKASERDVVLGRGGTQVVLDLANPAVQDFVFGVVDNLMTSYPEIDYIKWDANMSVQNHGSQYLTKDNQSHMYIEFHRGFEKICQRIRAKYPDLTIQACASGGGRANYGVLPYFDEFWVSDNTDALQRVYMQWGTSYFFPAIAMASHISAAPNHQTFRTIPLKYRIDVAMSGRLGMEIQPKNMTEEEKALCKNAIAEYKTIRPVVQLGDIYRLLSPYDKQGVASLMYVAPEKDKAVFYWWKTEHFCNQHLPRVKMAGLCADKQYRVHELNRIDNVPLNYEGKSFSGAYLMANGLEIPYNHKVDYHKQNDYSSRVLYLEEVK